MDHPTLGQLLAELNCPKSNARPHNAGNDANFTLCAAILLSIKGCEDWKFDTQIIEEETVSRIEALRAVAMSLLPGAKRSKVRKPRKKEIGSQNNGHLRSRRRSGRKDDSDA